MTHTKGEWQVEHGCLAVPKNTPAAVCSTAMDGRVDEKAKANVRFIVACRNAVGDETSAEALESLSFGMLGEHLHSCKQGMLEAQQQRDELAAVLRKLLAVLSIDLKGDEYEIEPVINKARSILEKVKGE